MRRLDSDHGNRSLSKPNGSLEGQTRPSIDPAGSPELGPLGHWVTGSLGAVKGAERKKRFLGPLFRLSSFRQALVCISPLGFSVLPSDKGFHGQAGRQATGSKYIVKSEGFETSKCVDDPKSSLSLALSATSGSEWERECGLRQLSVNAECGCVPEFVIHGGDTGSGIMPW